MPKLSSTNLDHVEYDSGKQTLLVIFKSKHAYEYTGVPVWIYNAMMLAQSQGAYFAAHIRGKYPHRKIR